MALRLGVPVWVALVSLTKSLALSEGPAVRVNAVAPGPVMTPLWTRPGGFADTLGGLHGQDPAEAVEHELSRRQLPPGRMGTPAEVAGVITFSRPTRRRSSPAASGASTVVGVNAVPVLADIDPRTRPLP